MTTEEQAIVSQPKPPEPFSCTEGLSAVEYTLMTLIHLDPNLFYLRRRDQLRSLARLFDQRFKNGQMGQALTQLRGHHNAKPSRLRSWAFEQPVPDGSPDLMQSVRTIRELSSFLSKNTDTKTHLNPYRLTLALTLLGHQVSEDEVRKILVFINEASLILIK